MFDLVIQEVCDASQVDFEESGVDQQTLLDLRQVCAVCHDTGCVTLLGGAEGGSHRLMRVSFYS